MFLPSRMITITRENLWQRGMSARARGRIIVGISQNRRVTLTRCAPSWTERSAGASRNGIRAGNDNIVGHHRTRREREEVKCARLVNSWSLDRGRLACRESSQAGPSGGAPRRLRN